MTLMTTLSRLGGLLGVELDGTSSWSDQLLSTVHAGSVVLYLFILAINKKCVCSILCVVKKHSLTFWHRCIFVPRCRHSSVCSIPIGESGSEALHCHVQSSPRWSAVQGWICSFCWCRYGKTITHITLISIQHMINVLYPSLRMSHPTPSMHRHLRLSTG